MMPDLQAHSKIINIINILLYQKNKLQDVEGAWIYVKLFEKSLKKGLLFFGRNPI